MSALERLIERLDVRIRNLKRVKKRLQNMGLIDHKLNLVINRLTSMRKRLTQKPPQQGSSEKVDDS